MCVGERKRETGFYGYCGGGDVYLWCQMVWISIEAPQQRCHMAGGDGAEGMCCGMCRDGGGGGSMCCGVRRGGGGGEDMYCGMCCGVCRGGGMSCSVCRVKDQTVKHKERVSCLCVFSILRILRPS